MVELKRFHVKSLPRNPYPQTGSKPVQSQSVETSAATVQPAGPSVATVQSAEPSAATVQSAEPSAATVHENEKPPSSKQGDSLEWMREISDANPLPDASPTLTIALSRVTCRQVQQETPPTEMGFFGRSDTNFFETLLTTTWSTMLDWQSRKALSLTSTKMYNIVNSNIAIYSSEKQRFLVYHRHNHKIRFEILSHERANNCHSLIMAIRGPSIDYEQNPTQDYETDRKETWQMLRQLSDPILACKIIEITFSRVDLLPSNIFPQSSMADFPVLRRLRILNCREFGLMDVASNDWSFLARRNIDVDYNWRFKDIPRTFAIPAGGHYFARMFKWREVIEEGQDAGKKIIFDNLKTNRRFRLHTESFFLCKHVPFKYYDDPGFCRPDDLHDFVMQPQGKTDNTWYVTRAVHRLREGYVHLAGNMDRMFTCRDCDVRMKGVCFPTSQIHGQNTEAPLCYGCSYDNQIYTVTAATSSQVKATRFNFVEGIDLLPHTISEVVHDALGIVPRPIIKSPLNVAFNLVCPLSLKDVTCPHQKKKACDLQETYVSLRLCSPNS